MATAAASLNVTTPYEQKLARRVEDSIPLVGELIDTVHPAMSKQLYQPCRLEDLVAAQDKIEMRRPGEQARTANVLTDPETFVVDMLAMVSSMVDDICALDHTNSIPQLALTWKAPSSTAMTTWQSVDQYRVTLRSWNGESAARIKEHMHWRLGMANAEVFENRLPVLLAARPG
ncbi:hypothetical protein DOTSEDRAFT_19504 [Dothistroma septosporum NZE10]|uniref:Uncharacterized protein n=1 Tax=Dothistroma septosporum (strain NZE10 / CBS 128990) TaxID=675120 RepID=N1Q2Y5_DOTSN|nr:hypothetical protein DOTSEDRAFT_19504 [Dothistroma septosporum NZE10]